MTTAVAAPFRFFSLRVVRTRRLGPSLTRVTFGGPDLAAFRSDGRDQSLSLFLPHPGQTEPAVPVELGDGWWQAWRELPDDVRAVMRSYTLRDLRRDALGNTDEIDIDFVLHGVGPGAAVQAGPASRWAARAAAGDRVLLLGPAVADNRAIRFRPPEDTDLVVVWGDETALPAVSAVLESLPAGTRARVWLEVPHAADVQELTTAADAEITWLVREGAGDPADLALTALRAARLPSARTPYVWIAGESGRVRALRRHFVDERGVDRRRVTFVGYWRQGLTEEQLREQG
ncbi:siderophore-interacting protein [Streptomyces sp. JHA26]|uniref:siderophore-interacting protein n=1 Tax=Streptomyces sp. JHA26 TaxID=1917143 RepID=UPI00098B1CE4|nr:siderophore-interacting protein [Streptomyces sp. JHA26]